MLQCWTPVVMAFSVDRLALSMIDIDRFVAGCRA